MRVAVGSVFHESNTFFLQPMTVERFAEKDLHYGTEILTHWNGTATEMAGFLLGAEYYGFEIVPTIAAWGMPLGPLTAETFEILSADLLSRLEDAKPLDGVLLSLHGAMVSEFFADGDGELLRRVRKVIGCATPLAVTLDYHANLTDEMIRWPDALIGYDTYPHVDQAERGFEAATILQSLITEKRPTEVVLARRPLLPHILRQATDCPPLSDALLMAHEAENRNIAISVSVAVGFAYSDVPDAGFSVYATADKNRVSAVRDAVENIADHVWQHRAQFRISLPSVEQAVRGAIDNTEGLTILVDVGDNVGAGTPGDGTFLLAELLKQKATDALVLLVDPEAVNVAISTGVRERVRIKVGGKADNRHGKPVEIEGVVTTINCGVFTNIGPMHNGLTDNQGRTAVIDTGGVLIVLTERRMPMWNLQQLRSLGIEPTRLRTIVVKAAIAYRAAYAPIARQIIEVDTPGLSAGDLKRFHYTRLKRPIFPLDEL